MTVLLKIEEKYIWYSHPSGDFRIPINSPLYKYSERLSPHISGNFSNEDGTKDNPHQIDHSGEIIGELQLILKIRDEIEVNKNLLEEYELLENSVRSNVKIRLALKDLMIDFYYLPEKWESITRLDNYNIDEEWRIGKTIQYLFLNKEKLLHFPEKFNIDRFGFDSISVITDKYNPNRSKKDILIIKYIGLDILKKEGYEDFYNELIYYIKESEDLSKRSWSYKLESI